MKTLLCVLAVLAMAPPALAETYVTEDITSSTSWTPAGSPYIVQADVEVISSTLTIQAGVTVAFDGHYVLKTGSFGAIIATGVSGTEILFTSNAGAPEPGDWTWVQVGGTNPSSFSYCIFEYAQTGLRANWADPTITHCTFRSCGNTGLFCTGASPTIEYCDMYGNRDGVGVDGSLSNPTINYCNIYNNTYTNIYVSNYPEPPLVTIDAENNWWGTDVEAEIMQEIRDSVDNPAVFATIDYYPWLHEIPVEASSWGRVKALFIR